MAAIAVAAVSLFPTGSAGERYCGGTGAPRALIERRLKITGVTAGDTASATVLGLGVVTKVTGGYNATAVGAFPCAVDPVNNGILIGAGPSNATIYLTVTGSGKQPSAT